MPGDPDETMLSPPHPPRGRGGQGTAVQCSAGGRTHYSLRAPASRILLLPRRLGPSAGAMCAADCACCRCFILRCCDGALALDRELSNCVRACGHVGGCRFSVFLVLSSESGSVVAVHEAALLSTHRATTHQQVEHRRPPPVTFRSRCQFCLLISSDGWSGLQLALALRALPCC